MSDSGPRFLAPRPECAFPAFDPAPVRLRPAPRVPDSGRRSTSDKTGEATRRRMREQILKRYGPHCHLCGDVIDLDLRWPDPRCFTRDHVRPRSKGGRDTIHNQRPAHKRCNESRGARGLTVKQPAKESE